MTTAPAPPTPTWLYRLVHVDNLPTLLTRGALHAPSTTPDDGLPYKTIHKSDVQASRHLSNLPCGPGGTLHDYVPFYFGPLSVMHLNLHTGRVPGYTEGQEPLVYLVTSVQALQQAGYRFIFSDGHGLATFTHWYDDLADLGKVDWSIVRERYWADKPEDNDRQRRKQAEFLVWKQLDWTHILGIGVLNQSMVKRVAGILEGFPDLNPLPVRMKPEWYYH